MVKGTVTRRASVAPRFLDPLLGMVERVDRWRRRIRPARAGGLLGIERGRFRDPPVVLGDGMRLVPGAPVWVLHLDNARLRALAGGEGWPTRAYAVAVDDLRAITARLGRLPERERPVALGGVTLLAPLSRRLGFTLIERPRTARSRLEDWYLRSLLARWAAAGRGRLARGHRALHASGGWISTTELLRRYEPPPE
jgi:hypothetical protein